MQKKDKENLRQRLSSEQWAVTQNKATERPFTGQYDQCWFEGEYYCICCQQSLFRSDDKFDAGCGWPSFHSVSEENMVEEITDYSHGMLRTEVVCQGCGSHLGHVFDDGPQPTGRRYCINSASLNFKSKQD